MSENGSVYTAAQIQEVMAGLADLEENRMALSLTARVRRIRKAFDEYHEPLKERLQEEFQKASDGKAEIDRTSKKGQEFLALLDTMMAEEVTVEFDPISLSELTSVGDLQLMPRSLNLLMDNNVIVD